MEKSNRNTVILKVIFVILIFILIGFILFDKIGSNLMHDVDNSSNLEQNVENNSNLEQEEDNNSNTEQDVDDSSNSVINSELNEAAIESIEIKNAEVEELYNYVQASLKSNNVCLGYFYQNPFKNHTLEDKISLVLINYASNYKKKIDDNFLQKISQNERDFVKNNSEYYIDIDNVKDGMKLIFNIDVEKFNDDSNYAWDYRSDVNAFVEIMGGGGYDAQIIQQIIEYNELDEEINFTVEKADLGYDGNVYRYVNKKDTLVYENVGDKFRFTKNNVSKFPQLKYVFRKNKNGKYYVSDILNLNFEEDFENCS